MLKRKSNNLLNKESEAVVLYDRFSVVAAIIIDDKGKILLSLRQKGKMFADLWEFPGGKVEKNETEETALCRELKEELAIDVAKEDLQFFTCADNDKIHFSFYLCRKWQGTPAPLESQMIKWADKTELYGLPMPPIDEEIKKRIQSLL